jgi:alanine-alpha-ketoisovalerate/valine-pyruvate aminotransferase
MNTDGNPAKADAEIPAGRKWCSFRKTAFSWTNAEFPIVTKRTELRLTKHPVISVIGKAFWDGQHAPAATTRNAVRRNYRTYDSTCSAWEVHPVMALTVVQE